MDHGLDIERRVRDRPAPAGQRARPAAGRDQRPALHARRATPRRTRCCCACSPARRWPTRTGSSSTASDFYLKSPAEMRHAVADARPARGLRQHAADRRAVRGRRSPRARTSCRASRCPSGETEDSWFVKEVERGLQRRYPDGVPPRRSARRPTTRSASSSQMGFPGYFLVVADLINWAKDNGIRVGPGPRLGRRRDGRLRAGHHRARPARARAAVRALPQPRARLDARHRHRLRRAPARRHDPLRHREVRRATGSRRSSPTARSRPSRRSRTRPRVLGYPFAMGDRITKAMPPPVMGKDVPLAGIFDPTHQALRRGRRVPRALRDRRRGQDGRRHRPRARGPQAAVGGARRRRDHVRASRCSTSCRSCGASRTARSSPSSTWAPARRLGLLKMDFLGLRNLTVLDDCLRNIEANRGETVVLEELDARRRGRPTSCWPAATRSACSSSTAGRCARCCAR